MLHVPRDDDQHARCSYLFGRVVVETFFFVIIGRCSFQGFRPWRASLARSCRFYFRVFAGPSLKSFFDRRSSAVLQLQIELRPGSAWRRFSAARPPQADE